MKDDLISRALILDEAKRISGPITGDGWDNWGVYGLIERQPSVPAVPLDKLCELLSHCTFPCNLLYLRCPNGECNKDTNNREDAIKCWKDVITKWMEEQDAAD